MDRKRKVVSDRGSKSLSEGHRSLTESIAQIPAATKPDDVAKLVREQIAAQQAASAQATASQAAKSAVREKVVGLHLKGVPESFLKLLPDTADEAALVAAATAIRADVEKLPGVKLADVGGVAKDGGSTAGTGAATPQYTPANTGMSDGMAKYASSIELPK